MIDFRNYSDLIRKCVAEENEKDKNWKWSVRSIGKNKVRICWGYLDYLEEKNNCFSSQQMGTLMMTSFPMTSSTGIRPEG